MRGKSAEVQVVAHEILSDSSRYHESKASLNAEKRATHIQLEVRLLVNTSEFEAEWNGSSNHCSCQPSVTIRRANADKDVNHHMLCYSDRLRRHHRRKRSSTELIYQPSVMTRRVNVDMRVRWELLYAALCRTRRRLSRCRSEEVKCLLLSRCVSTKPEERMQTRVYGQEPSCAALSSPIRHHASVPHRRLQELTEGLQNNLRLLRATQSRRTWYIDGH